MPSHALIFTLCLAAATLPLGMASHAAPPKPSRDVERVATLLTEAKQLLENGLKAPSPEAKQRLFQQALDKADEALALSDTASVWVFRARALELLLRDDEARVLFERVVADTKADEKIRDTASEGLKRLERRKRGVLELALQPADAEVKIDGRAVALVAGRIELTTGPHHLAVSHPDYLPHEQEVDVPPDDVARVAVALGAKPVVRTVEVPTEGAVDFGPWPWITLGVGAVAAGVGTYFVLDGNADWDAAEDESLLRADAEELVDRGTEKRTIGFVGLGVGGALILTSVVMLLLETSGDEVDTGAAPRLDPTRGGALTWTF